MERTTKQYIIIRKDLKMRRGKEIAQGCHACMLANMVAEKEAPEAFEHWMSGAFTKIALQVDSEEELLTLHQKALEMGIPSAVVTDKGATEFHGVPTKTALGIGPYWTDELFKLVGHLKLY